MYVRARVLYALVNISRVKNIRRAKYFACLIFVGRGRRRKFFNDENFPIYGILIGQLLMYVFVQSQLLSVSHIALCSDELVPRAVITLL